MDAIAAAVSDEDGVAVLTVSGEIDLATVSALDAAIDETLGMQPTAVVVDLSGVEFLASVGLQRLVTSHDRISSTSARFAVVADGPATSRPIQLTGLDEIFEVYSTLADALSHIRGSP